MKPYQSAFIELCVQQQVLRFGEFQLKSGRISPYFFNLGVISSGSALAQLAAAYADAFADAGLEADALFGPAYKGIPLAATLAATLAQRGSDLAFAYNRKEAKDHGEGGLLVGADLAGKRVVIVDDVLTAGTALREAVALLRQAGAIPVAAMIALDRQERGAGAATAVMEAQQDLGLQVVALVGLDEVMEYLRQGATVEDTVVAAMERYRARYGVR